MIVLFADSYEMVKENETIEALHERAKTIVDMELLYPVTSSTFLIQMTAVPCKPCTWAAAFPHCCIVGDHSL